jgi:hypothetical protein
VGIDSLYVSFYVDGLGFDWEALRTAKERLAAEPGKEFEELELGGERFALMRGGRKPYTFVLRNRAFDIGLSERMQPRCHVQFSSEGLWHHGAVALIARLRTMFASIGMRETRPEVISRVDAAFDFKLGSPDFVLDHFVSRASKDALFREHREDQTFSFGRGDVLVRVYDKVAEIEQQSGKAWLFDMWGTRDGVWRCEIQVRGERLKEAGITTFDHLRAHLPELVRELARKHTSLRTPGGDSNRSRWPLHPLWKALIANAKGLVTPPEGAPPPYPRGSQYLLEKRLQSFQGNVKGIAAFLSRRAPDSPVTLAQAMRWLTRMMQRRHSKELWAADVTAKARQMELGL